MNPKNHKKWPNLYFFGDLVKVAIAQKFVKCKTGFTGKLLVKRKQKNK